MNFAQNLIKELPDSVSSCEQLRVMDFTANAIAEIPESMAMLGKIEVLHLGQVCILASSRRQL